MIVESDGTQLIAVKRTDIDLDSPQGREMALADNASAKANIVFDAELIEAELGEAVCVEWGIDVSTKLEAVEDDFDVDSVTETDIVLGDLFEIGEHRLLCGDSTDSDAVARLMDGEKADMVFTDPPYLMDFTGGIHADGSKSFNAKHGEIKNDKMSKADGDDFLDAINANIQLFTKGAFYICFYRLKLGEYFESLKRTGLEVRALITWNKGNHTLSNSDYMSKCEHIFYGWVNEHNFYGGNNSMDIWEIPRTQKNELHPTMKPIPLCEKAISDASKSNDIVLDLFLGSGSTMVASHQLKRKCYGMELDPKYCQVILDRMRKLDPSLTIKRNGINIT
jgi:site-specific DNA-methyltransferase (adenine-specific)